MKLALVGATGMVGNVMLKVLEERNFPAADLFAVASKNSIGKVISFKNKNVTVIGIEQALEKKPDIAIFSAGGKLSKKWAPLFAKSGTTVIDNSSAWRMESDVKLIVPEINAALLNSSDKIIANPNCSTIQMVLALKGIQEKYGIKRLVISTYQSVSGTGVAAVKQLNNERAKIDGEMAYPHPIDLNCLPHGGDFQENGYTTEEIKLVQETNKIFGTDNIKVTATVVRVPVIGGHSESVNVELNKDFNLADIKQELALIPGVVVQDDTKNNLYPMPITAHNKDAVFVGRIRRDYSVKYGIDLWIVADNLRKGAATNAVQIAEYIIENNLI
ncbi:MAG: aspartate-semialdehyde dehydrogenase [Flavobacteriales bacterium]|nr:aspartate-semialdehyde dehydrogenase [Flavobacteriales bacterium]